MALEYARGVVQWLSADGNGTTYTVSGLSFQPKALRFFTTGIQSASNAVDAASHGRRSMGLATGTAARRCVGSQAQDNAGTSVCTTGYRQDCVAMTLTSTPAADGLLDLNAINSDGFQLIVDDQAPVDITVMWEAWGGDEIVNAAVGDIAEPAATGNVDYTVTGNFEPDVVMFSGVQATAAAPTAARGDSGFMIGWATGSGSAQAVACGNSDDASGTMDCDRYGQGGECLAMIAVAGGNPSARASFVQFNAAGFRLNWIARATTNRRYIYLAIEGGLWNAGEVTMDTRNLNNTATVSGLAYQPKGLSLINFDLAELAAGTSNTIDMLGFGTGTSPTDRGLMTYSDRDGISVSEIDLLISFDEIAGSYRQDLIPHLIDIDSINSDGFTLITDFKSTPEGVGALAWWMGYLTFGPAESETIEPGDGDSDGTSTAEGTGRGVGTAAGSSSGTSDGEGRGRSVHGGRGNAPGQASVDAAGQALAHAEGSTAGTGTATAAGQATAEAVGSAVGQADIAAVGRAVAHTVGNAVGQATVLGEGADGAAGTLVAGDGLAEGVATVQGVGETMGVEEAVGQAAGTSTASAVGQNAAQPAVVSGRVHPWRKYKRLPRRENPPIVLPKPELPAFEGEARVVVHAKVSGRAVVTVAGSVDILAQARVRARAVVSTSGMVTVMVAAETRAAKAIVAVSGEAKTLRTARASGEGLLHFRAQGGTRSQPRMAASRVAVTHPREEEELMMLLEVA